MTKRKSTRAARAQQPPPFNVADALRVFGFKAYSAALDFYARHHDDPDALAAYVAAAGAGFGVPADRDSIESFAYHLSEVLRVARDGKIVGPDFYNQLRDPVTSFITDEALEYTDAPEFIKFALELRESREKGDAGR